MGVRKLRLNLILRQSMLYRHYTSDIYQYVDDGDIIPAIHPLRSIACALQRAEIKLRDADIDWRVRGGDHLRVILELRAIALGYDWVSRFC